MGRLLNLDWTRNVEHDCLARFWHYAHLQDFPLAAETIEDPSELIPHLRVAPSDHILDVGCGAGVLAAGLANYCKVTALDAMRHPGLRYPDGFVCEHFQKTSLPDADFTKLLFSKSFFVVECTRIAAVADRLLTEGGELIVRECLPSAYWEGVLSHFSMELSSIGIPIGELPEISERSIGLNIAEEIQERLSVNEFSLVSIALQAIRRRYRIKSDVIRHFQYYSPLAFWFHQAAGEEKRRALSRLQNAVTERFSETKQPLILNALVRFKRSS